MTANNSSFLKNALFTDSVISLISGIAALLFSKDIASFLGVTTFWVVPVFGAAGIVYGIGIYLAARTEPVHTGVARFVIYGNLAGGIVIASLIFANLVSLRTAGRWTFAAVADIALILSLLQYIGLRRLEN